jgi:glycine oxidase
MKVALFEAQQIGCKASGAAAGMLGAHSECDDMKIFYPFARSSQKAYAQLQEEIQTLTGIDFEIKTGGIFKLAYSASEKEELRSALALPTVEWFEANEVENSVPGVNQNIIGAAYIKEDVNVLPTSVSRGLSKGAKILGASIYEYTTVLDIQKNGESYLIKTTRGSFEANYVVVANGVWSSELFYRLGLNHQLFPIKGEILSVSSETVSLKHTIFHNGSYVMPRKNGELIIGATMIANDWNEKPTLGGMEKLIDKAKSMLPAVTDMKINSFWAGLRPQTFDQKPFIGKHPEQDRILFATGHSRNGILLAPATGEMIRNLILEKPVNKDWQEAFKIDRKNPVLV